MSTSNASSSRQELLHQLEDIVLSGRAGRPDPKSHGAVDFVTSANLRLLVSLMQSFFNQTTKVKLAALSFECTSVQRVQAK